MKKLITLICVLLMGAGTTVYGQGNGNGNGNGNGPTFVKMCINGQTVSVPQNAVQGLLNAGATAGDCDGCIDPDLINPAVFCLAVYDPVCGCDGVTYSNACNAIYGAGVTSFTPGECGCVGEPLNVFCPTYYDPVCGCDGVTYSNGCFAAAAGVQSTTPGACGGTVFPAKTLPGEMAEMELSVSPNPFQRNANIQFTLTEDAGVAVKVYGMDGKLIKTLYDGVASAGFTYSFELKGEGLQSGIYYVKLITEKDVRVEKLLLAK